MNRKNIIIGSLAALLLASVAAGLYMRSDDNERIKDLEEQIGELRKEEQRAKVDRRVSRQMEQIAYGQQALSEERSREAIRQSEIAQMMTLRSESERQNAIEAMAAAEGSAKEALESYQLAERQRIEAELARHVADTLNYISLGRTLGTQAYAIYRTGNTELGNILAYASYLFTHDYGGNLYSSAVYPALTQSAESQKDWSIHNGSITKIDFFPQTARLLTVSNYGEIYNHEMKNGQLSSKLLFNNKNYRFRDAYASKDGKSYAVSHTGHLVVAGQGKAQTVYLEGLDRPFAMMDMNGGRQLLIAGERSIALFDLAADRVIRTRKVDFNIVGTGRMDNKPLLFDDQNRMHIVDGIDDLKTRKQPVTGRVTAFARNKEARLSAYGMADGTIWLIDDKGHSHKLAGHLSQVTRMMFDGRRLFSSSYDCKLLFWMTSDAQIMPITLFESDSWLMDFTFDTKRNYIWTAWADGTITEYLTSLPLIGERLRKNVKRNFTQEEWNYYVGKIPYRKVKE